MANREAIDQAERMARLVCAQKGIDYVSHTVAHDGTVEVIAECPKLPVKQLITKQVIEDGS